MSHTLFPADRTVYESLILSFLSELADYSGDRQFLKALHHFIKLLSVYRKRDYHTKLVLTDLSVIDFDWDGRDFEIEVVSSKDREYGFLYNLIEVLHPTFLGDMRGWILKAYSDRGLLGLIAFAPPPAVIKGRSKIGLNGHMRSKDGLNSVRGQFINSFLWASKSIVFGNFRASRGLKLLYHSVFTPEVYTQISLKARKHFTAIETTTLYSLSSSVFRNLRPLRVYHSITDGWSDGVIPAWLRDGKLQKTYRDNKKRQLIKKFLLRKGYYMLTPYEDIQRVYRDFLSGKPLEKPPLYPLNPGILNYSTDHSEKDYYHRYLSLEKQIIKLFLKELSQKTLEEAFRIVHESKT